MTAKLQINTRVRRLIHYIEDIEKGLIQIPAFQRDFIWDKKNKLDLFDSLKRGYPIGSILFWKPSEKEFDENKKIGPYYVPDKKENYFYILDGFQRLSTLFGCLINPNKTKLKVDEKELENDFSIYYDLKEEEFFIPRPNSNVENYQIPLYIFLDTFEFLSTSQKLLNHAESNLFIERARNLATTLVDFSLSSIDITGGEIQEAVEIFSRINSKGSAISPDWMLSALTYNQDKDFRLGTIIDNLIEDLKEFNFQDIKRDLILQCITNSFGKAYFDQSGKIEELARRSDFIEKTNKVVESVKKAVKFLFDELLVIDFKLLPYRNQLIFITDFFNSVKEPTIEQKESLKKWFWITTYSNYFTIYSLSKQREAYNKFQQFINSEIVDPLYNDRPSMPFSVSDFPNKIFFGSVRAKALILFLLNYSNFNKTSYESDNKSFLNLYYLFREVKGISCIYYSESVFPTINGSPIKKSSLKNTDIFEIISSEVNFIGVDYKNYFITHEMIALYYEGKKLEILKKRKELIVQAEKEFVESLGMNYEYKE